MDKILFVFLLWLTKLISFLISVFHVGQASNFPGKIALVLQKDFLKQFNIKKECKIILVTGTNGKSTTCGLLASILKKTGKKIIYNKSGANLLSGVASTFSHYSNLIGNLTFDYIILEIDEATLPKITQGLKPDIIAVTNFFRDQLDRYGELDMTARLIEKGIANNKNTTIVLNADDARVAFLKTENKKIFYGIACTDATVGHLNNSNNNWISDPEEATSCPNCNSNLVFKNKYLAHLGDYTCSKCDLKRPEINFSISNFKIDKQIINFDLVYENHKHNFFLPMTGIFNLYNAICAISIAKTISDVTPVQIQKGLDSYSTIFGRGEKINFENKNAWIYLIKNPTGTTEVLKTFSTNPTSRFLIAINDNFADGRDVSWLWDARFDILLEHKKTIFVSGKRAYDMALRLKYAGIENSQVKINEKISGAIKDALNSLSENETLYILPTYTVLLEMQRKDICKSALLT